MASKENYGELRVRHSDDYRLSRLARAGDALGLEAALKDDSELDSDYAKMAMLEAARTSLACVEVLLAHGHSAGRADRMQTVPIAYAAGVGRVDCLRRLLEVGAWVDERSGNTGETALMCAAMSGQVECAAELLSWGADINARDAGGFTALCHAARSGKASTVKFLVEAGADIDMGGDRKESPLCLAGWAGYADCVRMLLELGAGAESWGPNSHIGIYSRGRDESDACGQMIRAEQERRSLDKSLGQGAKRGWVLRV